jgi:hypothetical protein
LAEGRSLDQSNIDLNPKLNKATKNDWIGFLAAADREYSVEMRKLFREELGIKALLVDTQVQWGGTTGLRREQDSDLMDTHAYFCHPDFGSGAWDPVRWTVDQKSWVQEYSMGSGTSLAEIAAYRVADLPFSVSEYDHPAPNKFRAEMYPVTSTVAAIQDWDAVYAFAHGDWSNPRSVGKINGFFDNAFDPSKFCFAPAASILFRNGLVEPATQTARLKLTSKPWEVAETAEAIWSSQLHGDIDPLATRYAIDRKVSESIGIEKSKGSDTSSVTKLENKTNGPIMVSSNANVFVASGFLGGQELQFAEGTVYCEAFANNFGSMMLVPMDGKPLATSNRMLLTVMAKAENTNMRWNSDRNSVGDRWGNAPSIVQGIAGRIAFKNPIAAMIPLKPDGSRSASTGSGSTISFSPLHKTVWYELTR